MRALVVYESMYGNTHAVAVSIAAGLSTRHDVTPPRQQRRYRWPARAC
jgi:flavodoxin